VKQRDPLWRYYFREVHRHDDGVCTLDQFLAADHWVRTSCYIDQVWRGRQIHCGCGMCTDQESRRMKRRRQRHEARRALRLGYWDNLDVELRQDAWCTYNVQPRPLDKDLEN
jgi:hypothetical protein